MTGLVLRARSAFLPSLGGWAFCPETSESVSFPKEAHLMAGAGLWGRVYKTLLNYYLCD